MEPKSVQIFVVKVYHEEDCHVDSAWVTEELAEARKGALKTSQPELCILITEIPLEGVVLVEEAAGLIRGLLSVFDGDFYKSMVTLAHAHAWVPDQEDEEYKANTAAVRAARAWLKERNDAPPPTTT